VSANHARFLDAADRIGHRLCRDAVWSGGRCSWQGWAIDYRAGQWVTAYRAAAANLYDGTSGIGLFLARLAHLTGDSIIRATAEAAFAQALGALDALVVAGEYGFYSGWSGIAWACREAGILLEHEGLTARGEAALRLSAGTAPNGQRLDVINGSAGLILTLLDAAAESRSEELLTPAVRHGEHLVRLAKRGQQGYSWNTFGTPNKPDLLGFAHGASGIACALAALAHETERSDFLDSARGALGYERSHFRPEEGNWPDLRSFAQPMQDREPPCMIAWCHGATGIGIARLALHHLLPEEPEILREAEIAIRTTAATLQPSASQETRNFSLCHGDTGNADLLLLASDQLGRPELREQAEAVGIHALEEFEDSGSPWPCGVRGAGETPNLMLGLAGIGYFFLRLYDLKAIPTVLLPAARAGGSIYRSPGGAIGTRGEL
jgi:lantibiotic biosynthesis protein